MREQRYGLTGEDFAAILAGQGGACAICRMNEPGGQGGWHLDHDHTCCSGKTLCGDCTRGVLCARCNLGLGQFRDSVTSLLAAAEYVAQRARMDS